MQTVVTVTYSYGYSYYADIETEVMEFPTLSEAVTYVFGCVGDLVATDSHSAEFKVSPNEFRSFEWALKH